MLPQYIVAAMAFGHKSWGFFLTFIKLNIFTRLAELGNTPDLGLGLKTTDFASLSTKYFCSLDRKYTICGTCKAFFTLSDGVGDKKNLTGDCFNPMLFLELGNHAS